MIEFDFKAGTKEPVHIKIAGIGGAGTNVLDRLVLDGIENADLIAFNTDAQSLTSSVAAEKVQLGRQATRGLGAGGDPEVGFLACEEAAGEIGKKFEGAGMVFLCTGLGGGTGSGATPLIAQIAREQGALVIVFATIPFIFEGKRRKQQAEEALLSLQEHADVVICFENEKMGDSVAPKAGIHQAFASADQTVSQSIRAICNLFNRPGLIKIGFDELSTVLRSQSSSCLFGYGEAEGDNRANDCLARALKNPLMDRGRLLSEAQSVLVNVAGSPSMTLNEVNILMTELNRHVGDQTHILFGTAIDPKMGNRMSVTLVSAIGPEQPQWVRPHRSEPESEPDRRLSEPDRRLSEPKQEPIPEAITPPLPAQAVPEPEPIPQPQPASIDRQSGSDVEPQPEQPPVRLGPEPASEVIVATGEILACPSPLFTNMIESIPFAPEPLQEPASEPLFPPEDLLGQPPVRLGQQLEPEMPWDEPSQAAPQEELAALAPSFLEVAKAEAPENSQSGSDNRQSGSDLQIQPTRPSAVRASIRTTASPARTSQQRRVGELNLNIPPAPSVQKSPEIKQETLQFEPITRGRFEKSEPTIVDGQDLDVPTFLRRNVRIK